MRKLLLTSNCINSIITYKLRKERNYELPNRNTIQRQQP